MIRLPRILCALAIIWLPGLAASQDFDTSATAAWVYDQSTETILLSKNADTPLPPASMSKLMTLYMAFEAVANGTLEIDQELPVSQHAMDYGGSSMFLRSGERVRVDDLLRGVIVLSGNDASVVLAEALSNDGTEATFARQMTDRARELGMNNSVFLNSNGWPAAGHVMSMHDLGILANRLILDFPTFYPLFAETEFLFDNRVPSNTQNRNPILGLDIGADGLKTGHTQEAGFGLVGSAKQGDRRIVFVITGLDTAEARRDESERIVNWAFRQFVEADVTAESTQVAQAEVWMGEVPLVGLQMAHDVSLLLPIGESEVINAEAVYNSPIEAPVEAGQVLGELVISRTGLPDVTVPLIAMSGVAQGGFGIRLQAAASVLLSRFGPTFGLGAAAADQPGLDGA
jgi:serine-type D-Ala-D-Ala carboxypeptidase (penicillin-binding protein 5/6)